MNIRTATKEDSNGIGAVLENAYNIDSVEEGVQVFLSETNKDHHYIVAEDKGKIVGIVTWLPHGLPKHMMAELDRIAVLPECRGKGVSKLLFEKLKEECDAWYKKKGFHLRKLYLLTHADNERAQAFYKKMGFTHETTLKSHYYDGTDEWVMSIFF